MKLPQRQSLAAETERVIRAMIYSGEIKQKLPGERDFAARLQVGRDTLRAALVELEKAGWISQGCHGKRRSILKAQGDRGAEVNRRRIGFLSPKRLEELTPNMLLEIDQVREMLARKDISLEMHSPSIFSLKRPGARLQELVDSHHYDVWILHQSNESVQQWFAEQGTPCLVRGQVYPGIELPSLDQDWQAIGYHAAISLIAHGHRSIGLVIPNTHLRGLHTVKDGVEDAIAKSSKTVKLHSIVENGSTSALALAALLQRTSQTQEPPTAMLATRSRQVLTISSWLASRRLCIPEDMSLISLTYDNTLDALLPQTSHYHSNVSTMARSLARKLDAVMEGQGQGEKLLIPDFVLGKSIRKV